MENTNKITVKAEYTVPQTTEIDALLKEFAIAKQITAQTKEELTPLIMAEGKAKYDAIMEQLQPIIAAMNELSILTGGVIKVSHCYSGDCRLVGSCSFVVITYHIWNHTDIYFDNSCSFDWNIYSSRLCGSNGLITRWNEYGIIDHLKDNLNRQIKRYIESESHKAQSIRTNYAEMHS